MSNESKRSSRKSTGTGAKTTPRDLHALDQRILAEARELAAQYTMIIQPHARRGYLGSSLEMPTVFISGATISQCEKKLREALMVAIAVMLERGEAPPEPASEDKRTQQVNIRLTPNEKLLLETAAKRRGFRGVSDFIRTTALNQTRLSA